jgi:hypothetical protein
MATECPLPSDSLGFCLVANECLANIDTDTPLADRETLVPCLIENECFDLDSGGVPEDSAGQCLMDKGCFEGLDLSTPLGERNTLIPCMLEHDCFSDVDVDSDLEDREGLVSCLASHPECLLPGEDIPIDVMCIQRIPVRNPNPVGTNKVHFLPPLCTLCVYASMYISISMYLYIYTPYYNL